MVVSEWMKEYFGGIAKLVTITWLQWLQKTDVYFLSHKNVYVIIIQYFKCPQAPSRFLFRYA